MNSNNSISCSSSSNHANLEKDHLQEISSSSERSISSQDDGVLLLASSRPKKRGGRKKFKETRHPIYRGVRRRNNNKWVCEVREPSEQKRIWLGTYPTPEMAARAHDVAALALRGSLATLNFEDSHWRLEMPVSNDPKELRQAAIKAANALHQVSHDELIEADYMNREEINSSEGVNLKCQENIVMGGGPSGSDNNLVGIKEMNNNIQNMEMDNTILCCNWGGNNEMLELEGSSSWQEKMAKGLLFSPTPCLGNCFNWDDVDTSEVDVSLWSYSI